MIINSRYWKGINQSIYKLPPKICGNLINNYPCKRFASITSGSCLILFNTRSSEF